MNETGSHNINLTAHSNWEDGAISGFAQVGVCYSHGASPQRGEELMQILVALRNCGRLALFLCASATVAVSAAAQPAPPTPADVPAAPPIIRPYALIKPRAVFSASAVESFSQPNASAATAAGNPVLAAFRDEASLTFQVAQSRLGVWFAEGSPVRGQLELDFINFGVSSPTVASVPRLRIAKVEWALSDSTLLMAGQDWDLFAPVNFHTINFVANAFQAGNTGFMRQQAKLIWHNDSLEIAGAIGLAGINAGRILTTEYNLLPTLAGRAALLLGPAGRIGLNFIGTQWRYARHTPTERSTFAGGGGVYGDLTPVKPFNVRFEAYVGQNMATLGTLGLGAGNINDDIQEVGGILSAKFGFTENHAVYGLFGLAKVLNDDKVVPSYTYPTLPADGTAPAETSAAPVAGNPGIAQNLTARLGYEYRYDKSIAFMLEGFMFNTKHVLNADFDADLEDTPTAVGAELGLVFTL